MLITKLLPEKFHNDLNKLMSRYLGLYKNEHFEKRVSKIYQQAFEHDFCWSNPRTFNEKIQWIKLYDASPLKTLLADKYLARKWISERIGEEYLVPLIGVWDNFDDIDFDKLPNRFALKCNHGSGWNVIVSNKNELNHSETKKKFDRWMNKNYAYFGYEMHYKNIPPKIIAEEYLETKEGLKDFRFFCFNGEPKQIWVDLYSGTPRHIRSVFDLQWNKIPLVCTWPDGGELLVTPPKSLSCMIEMAKTLSKDFCFVRVDFFEVNGKIYMGEMTFTPMNGVCKFNPVEWDYKLGEWLTLPEKNGSL